jgi:hypothetical protein
MFNKILFMFYLPLRNMVIVDDIQNSNSAYQKQNNKPKHVVLAPSLPERQALPDHRPNDKQNKK